MLILSRKPGEKVYIGKNKDVTVQIVSVSGKHVRLAFEAGNNVPIFREEVLERIEREGAMTLKIDDDEDTQKVAG
ncbi:MAG: carbon storage regulator [Gammaproteobacteria bacterium]